MLQYDLAMALRTRVWSAGKLLLLVARAAGDLCRCSPPPRCGSRCARAKCTVPDLTNRTANDATAVAAALGLTLQVDDTPAAGSEDRRRPRARAGSGRRLASRGGSAASRSG